MAAPIPSMIPAARALTRAELAAERDRLARAMDEGALDDEEAVAAIRLVNTIDVHGLADDPDHARFRQRFMDEWLGILVRRFGATLGRGLGHRIAGLDLDIGGVPGPNSLYPLLD